MNKKNINIAIIGLGYVGLPLAIEFEKKFKVVGFDTNKKRVLELQNGYDRTNEINKENLLSLKNLKFSSNKDSIDKSNIYIVTVPTPVDNNKVPDLKPLISATKVVGEFIKEDNIIIYESTVYPGCTEEICVPILEKESEMKYNQDFFCGYSPERINPGDRKRSLTKITKITSGSTSEISDFIANLYNEIITAGVFKASSIAVAEAAKVIENIQRDVNIALINELALIFNKLNLDTKEILDAAKTKWNFIPFQPGLVGGHCIGVDPYYLTHKAKEVGYHPEIILAGRKLNDNMGSIIAEKTISELAAKGISTINSKITVFGLTFKENCPDLRNSGVIQIIDNLQKFGCKINVVDSWADYKEAKEKLNIKLQNIKKIKNQDAIILAVAHKEYSALDANTWEKMLNNQGILIDIKSIFSSSYFKNTNIEYWRL